MLSGKTTKSKRTISTRPTYRSAIYSEKQRSTLVRSRRRSRAPRLVGDIERYSVQNKQAQAFQKRKSWHIESGFWSNKDIKDVKYNTQKNRIHIQNPLWRKMRGMNCLWSVKSQQKRQNLPSSRRLNRQSHKKIHLFLSPPPTKTSFLNSGICTCVKKASHYFPVITNNENKRKTPQLLIYRSN